MRTFSRTDCNHATPRWQPDMGSRLMKVEDVGPSVERPFLRPSDGCHAHSVDACRSCNQTRTQQRRCKRKLEKQRLQRAAMVLQNTLHHLRVNQAVPSATILRTISAQTELPSPAHESYVRNDPDDIVADVPRTFLSSTASSSFRIWSRPETTPCTLNTVLGGVQDGSCLVPRPGLPSLSLGLHLGHQAPVNGEISSDAIQPQPVGPTAASELLPSTVVTMALEGFQECTACSPRHIDPLVSQVVPLSTRLRSSAVEEPDASLPLPYVWVTVQVVPLSTVWPAPVEEELVLLIPAVLPPAQVVPLSTCSPTVEEEPGTRIVPDQRCARLAAWSLKYVALVGHYVGHSLFHLFVQACVRRKHVYGRNEYRGVCFDTCAHQHLFDSSPTWLLQFVVAVGMSIAWSMASRHARFRALRVPPSLTVPADTLTDNVPDGHDRVRDSLQVYTERHRCRTSVLCCLCHRVCVQPRCCSACKTVLYCGAQCQRKDWKHHRDQCTTGITTTASDAPVAASSRPPSQLTFPDGLHYFTVSLVLQTAQHLKSIESDNDCADFVGHVAALSAQQTTASIWHWCTGRATEMNMSLLSPHIFSSDLSVHLQQRYGVWVMRVFCGSSNTKSNTWPEALSFWKHTRLLFRLFLREQADNLSRVCRQLLDAAFRQWVQHDYPSLVAQSSEYE